MKSLHAITAIAAVATVSAGVFLLRPDANEPQTPTKPTALSDYARLSTFEPKQIVREPDPPMIKGGGENARVTQLQENFARKLAYDLAMGKERIRLYEHDKAIGFDWIEGVVKARFKEGLLVNIHKIGGPYQGNILITDHPRADYLVDGAEIECRVRLDGKFEYRGDAGSTHSIYKLEYAGESPWANAAATISTAGQ